ncbi:MAG: FAD-binding oxidoreductase [Acidobacteria bacterium]|nr:FAD-binding oxidoreductase [Acidobacteriota bacterium]
MGGDRIVIIGAGMAGVATAYFLTRKGHDTVSIIEREKIAGTQSTGRNAAILRTMIPNPLLNRLARESAEFYRNPPEGFSTEHLVDCVGVYLAARKEHAATLQKWCDDNPEAGLELSDASQIYDKIPVLAPGLTLAAYKHDDGVLDVHTILQGFLQGATQAGAELCIGREFTRLEIRDGRVVGVQTAEGFMEASKVVVANGAWASLSETFSGYSLPFKPYRRHLLVTDPLPQVNPRWPVVWIVGEEFYFRPESGGLLMSGCDAVPVTPDQGEITDPSQVERIAAKAEFWLPTLVDARIARAWAGMRTFVPDDLFVIGPDPRAQGLYWVAGLGGHGITCAPVVGRMAAEWIAEGECRHPAAESLAPKRLLK